MPDVGSFEDLLAQARQQGGAAPAAPHEQQDGGDAAVADGSPGGSGQKGAAAAAAAGPAGQQGGRGGGEEDGEDLLIMDSDEEGGEDVRLVDLPSSTRKKQQERMPWITQVGGGLVRCLGWGWGGRAGGRAACTVGQWWFLLMVWCVRAVGSMLQQPVLFESHGAAVVIPHHPPPACRWTAMRTRS